MSDFLADLARDTTNNSIIIVYLIIILKKKHWRCRERSLNH